jgi:hypothetical protein
MSSLDVWYENTSRHTLCFNHAVKAAIEGERITTEVQDNNDAGMSGAWWVERTKYPGGCEECDKELESDNKS